MSTLPIKVPTDSSTFSPLVIEALKLLPKFFLYPSLLQLRAQTELGSSSTSVELRIHPINWRLIPWLFNAVVLIAILTAGSCVYVIARPIFMEFEFKVEMATKILLIAFAGFSLEHTAVNWAFWRKPEIADVINYFISFQSECKNDS